MAQGKLKVKNKLPSNVKVKKVKGGAITKKKNAPVQKKKPKNDKTKTIVSKMVNKRAEDEIRSMATAPKPKLSKAQEAVVKHHSKKKAK